MKVGTPPIERIDSSASWFSSPVVTPGFAAAISVLSALEGVELAAPWFKRAVMPLTCLVLLALFAIQRSGTGGIGKIFGPVMVAWFVTIGALGAWHAAKNPAVYDFLFVGFCVMAVMGPALFGVGSNGRSWDSPTAPELPCACHRALS